MSGARIFLRTYIRVAASETSIYGHVVEFPLRLAPIIDNYRAKARYYVQPQANSSGDSDWAATGMRMQGQTNCLLDEPPDPGGGAATANACRRAEIERRSKEWPSARAFTRQHPSLAGPPLSSCELVWLARLLPPWEMHGAAWSWPQPV